MGRAMTGMLATILWGVMLVPASGQSLADVARQEEARRAKVRTSGKVLTNADLPASAILQPASVTTPAAEGVDGTASPAGDAEASTEGAPAKADGAPAAAKAPTDDEAGWTQRAAAVNKALADAQAEARLLRALADRLALEMHAGNPAAAERAARERDDVKTRMAAVEARELDANAARRALELEARAAGVPPAWIQ